MGFCQEPPVPLYYWQVRRKGFFISCGHYFRDGNVSLELSPDKPPEPLSEAVGLVTTSLISGNTENVTAEVLRDASHKIAVKSLFEGICKKMEEWIVNTVRRYMIARQYCNQSTCYWNLGMNCRAGRMCDCPITEGFVFSKIDQSLEDLYFFKTFDPSLLSMQAVKSLAGFRLIRFFHEGNRYMFVFFNEKQCLLKIIVDGKQYYELPCSREPDEKHIYFSADREFPLITLQLKGIRDTAMFDGERLMKMKIPSLGFCLTAYVGSWYRNNQLYVFTDNFVAIANGYVLASSKYLDPRSIRIVDDEVFLEEERLQPLGQYLPSRTTQLDSGFVRFEVSEFSESSD